MYQVLFDGYTLHDLRDERLVLRDPGVHLAVGEAGEMKFTIDPGHPYAARLTRLKGTLELWAGQNRIYKGRIRKDTRDFYLSREIETEGLLACLNDSIIPPFTFPDDFLSDSDYQEAAESGNVVEFFLDWVLQQHNSQVGTAQQIQLGTVTVADPNNYITRASSEYLTAMEVVRKKLEDLLGGYLLVDYSGDVTKLHYYAELPLTNVQTVEFGKNLLDLMSELDSADTFTAILPVGADGLTIEALPDGELSNGIVKSGRIIYSEAAEAETGGRITRKVEWKDVTEASNLQTKAAAHLVGEGAKTAQTITVKAVDLGTVEDLPRFVVGRQIRIDSAPHGFADTWPLMELDPDILDPGNTTITIGETVKTATGIAHANQSAVQERQDQMQLELQKQNSQLTELPSTIRENMTAAIQTAESIIFSALENYVETSNLEEFRQTIATEMEVLAGEVNMRFTTTTEQIESVNGDLQVKFTELYKHIAFSDNGVTIGGSSGITLGMDNDLGIVFSKNGVPFGWWDGNDFHTGNIVVEVNERAQFGNFAFIPRSDGSLSFLKVGG